MLYIEHDEQAAGHAYGKAGDIDDTVNFPAEQVPEGDLKKVFKHNAQVWSNGGTKYMPYQKPV